MKLKPNKLVDPRALKRLPSSSGQAYTSHAQLSSVPSKATGKILNYGHLIKSLEKATMSIDLLEKSESHIKSKPTKPVEEV